MVQSNADHFDWSRRNKTTRSVSTGPSRVAEGDWFLYTEASAPRIQQDEAIIVTGYIQHSGPVCLRFQYHMYGVTIGELRVDIRHQDNGVETVFVNSSNLGDMWLTAEIAISEWTTGDQVAFIGTRGNDAFGDIAIDDIHIDGGTCNDPEDATECMTGHQCSQQCHNTPGSYTCSCGATYILAQDGINCIDCQAAYQKVADSMQAFSSDCPTTRTRLGVSLQTCLLEACETNASVVTFVNEACSLKQCPEGDLQLIVGVAGWDIYVLNITWSGEPTPALKEGFPLWQVLVGVFIGIAVIVAVVVGVIFGRRSQRRSSPARGTVQYENSPLDTASTVAANPELPADKEAGVYSEITMVSVDGIRVDRDNRVVYQNSAFQGEEPYQGLGPTDPRDPQPYQIVN